jgi:hypothetical protein
MRQAFRFTRTRGMMGRSFPPSSSVLLFPSDTIQPRPRNSLCTSDDWGLSRVDQIWVQMQMLVEECTTLSHLASGRWLFKDSQKLIANVLNNWLFLYEVEFIFSLCKLCSSKVICASDLQNVDTNFADKRRSPGRYSSLADSSHVVS